MAPEQAAGRHDQIGPAADIYALGAILYHCLTGRPPFMAATITATFRQAQTTAGPQTNHVYLRVLTQFTKILEGDMVTDSYGSLSATWFDDDNDGFLDLFVANSTLDTPPRVADNLYRNQGDGTFVKVLDSAFAASPAASAMGAPGDFDNDGDLDLITTLDGEDADQLFRNVGKGNFSLVADQPFSAPGAAGLACGWADYDLDGDIDLFAA